jgi:hypothetical protein
VIPLLYPCHQGEDVVYRQAPQGQDDRQEHPQLRHRQRWGFFFPGAPSGATGRNAPASWSA